MSDIDEQQAACMAIEMPFRWMLNASLILTAIFCSIAKAEAESALSTAEVAGKVIVAATNYAKAISSCNSAKIEPRDIATLVPEEKYAVLWYGDIGCAGGSGTSTLNITIVNVGAVDTYK